MLVVIKNKQLIQGLMIFMIKGKPILAGGKG